MRAIFFIILFAGASARAGQVTVSGKCVKKVKPDRASMTFEVNVLTPKPTEAQKKAAAISAALIKNLKKLEFKDQELSTANLSLIEEYDYNDGKQRSKGFRAMTSLTLATSEIDRIGEAIPVAVDSGAKSFGGLSVYLSNELFEKSYNECLAGALADAKMKAKKVLAAEGKVPGELLELNEQGAYIPQPIPQGRMDMAMAEGAAMKSAPQIEVKDSSVEANVTAKFKF